jgi:N-dimethylarginine dimethylaminohydrolase
MDNIQKRNICTNVPSSQTFRAFLHLDYHFAMISKSNSALCCDKFSHKQISTHRNIRNIFSVMVLSRRIKCRISDQIGSKKQQTT